MGKFLGVYDYTVILTYLSLISSLLGLTQAFSGHFPAAIICLAVSGLCDGFDGRVARVKKNRTEDEKAFGIQLDSLCDVFCFGIYPAMLCYNMGMNGVLGLIIVCFFSLCAVIRLAFFNVLEGKRQQTEGGSTKAYHGLPVTSIAFILPLTFWIQFLIPDFLKGCVQHRNRGFFKLQFQTESLLITVSLQDSIPLWTRIFLLFVPQHHKAEQNQSNAAAGAQHPGIQTVSNHKPDSKTQKQAATQMRLSAHKKHPLQSLCRGCMGFTLHPERICRHPEPY